MIEQENFALGKLTPKDQLKKEGYTRFGAVVLIVDARTGKFLWFKSTIDKPSTANRIGDWQCLCESSERGESPIATAKRGLREELDHRPEVLKQLGKLYYLGEVPFVNGKDIMSRVFITAWHGPEDFTDFTLGNGVRETDKPTWLSPDQNFPGKIRTGVFQELVDLGEQVDVDSLIEFAQTGDFKK